MVVSAPARPMIDTRLEASSLDLEGLKKKIKMLLASVDPNGIVRLKIGGEVNTGALGALSSAALREAAPSSMNVSIAGSGKFREASRKR